VKSGAGPGVIAAAAVWLASAASETATIAAVRGQYESKRKFMVGIP
jgi:hypothetical protein